MLNIWHKIMFKDVIYEFKLDFESQIVNSTCS